MPIRHSTLHQLRIFEALARHLSVARTAEEMFMTPPAVSIQVKQLSETIGLPLTEQMGKRLYLTPAGEILAGTCRDVLERLERASQALAELQGMERGKLKLAILNTTKCLVPRLVGVFYEQHPGIEISLQLGNRSTLLQRLADNLDDLYVLGQPPQKLRVVAQAFAENPLVAIAHPGHVLAGQTDISPQRLAEEAFIAREPGSGTSLAYERFFQALNLHLRIRMESASNEAIKQMISGRLGISILSEHCIRTELASGVLVKLDVCGFPLMRQWFLVYREGKQLSQAAQAFWAFLLNNKRE
jgi:LysR family transcriptional regulator, low CO2-responsive transcriptional regulator